MPLARSPAASRYRDRHAVSRKKSDHGDAVMLANILRTDAAAHRPLPADSELVQAIQVLARAQQDAVWDAPRSTPSSGRCSRSTTSRSSPRSTARTAAYYRPEARALLAAAPTPATAAKLTTTQLRAILRQAGRRRGIDAEADRLATILRGTTWRRQPERVERAMGQRALALLRQLDAVCAGEQDLARAAGEAFNQHPDADILTSFPGSMQNRCSGTALSHPAAAAWWPSSPWSGPSPTRG